MSKLFYTEDGLAIQTQGEELTRYRHARKDLELPATLFSARLFFSAYAHPGSESPLHILVNGHTLPPVQPRLPVQSSLLQNYYWYEVELPAAYLAVGRNTFEFWSNSQAMNSWGLALEPGHAEPASFLSNDSGRTWRNHHMGHLNILRGEYLVRVRVEEGNDLEPPVWTSEDPLNESLVSIRTRLPQGAVVSGTTLERVRILATWIASAWEYRASVQAAQYAPWDMETILSWGKSKSGHCGRLPVVMCVHYGVAFVTACQAAGLQARAAVFTENINGGNGHFCAEVWMPEYGKWVFVDPNFDIMLFRDSVPLSIPEIRALMPEHGSFIRYGPGYEYQRSNHIMEGALAVYANFSWMTHRSLWWRADFLSNPQFSPPSHGALAYCETGLVWEEKELYAGFAMFPCFGSDAYFSMPPR